jgi:hypothetical protein
MRASTSLRSEASAKRLTINLSVKYTPLSVNSPEP